VENGSSFTTSTNTTGTVTYSTTFWCDPPDMGVTATVSTPPRAPSGGAALDEPRCYARPGSD
jgi:hypothetical protein